MVACHGLRMTDCRLRPAQSSRRWTRGFTLIELLVVVSIISVIMAITLPAFKRARIQANNLLSMNNQKQVTSSINIFANDNDDRYPESVATIGYGDTWNWSDPRTLTGPRKRSPRTYRSLSGYLKEYIKDPSALFCPSSPSEYQYLKQSWEAGDDWDNPDTSNPSDPVGGSYCFYWNYKGVLEEQNRVFQGPRDQSGGKRQSKLLLTDYFGYGNWQRIPPEFGSCEVFEHAVEVPETLRLSSFWSAPGTIDNIPEVTLRAGYVDGHVETYSSRETVPMQVSITSDGKTPYPEGVGPGTFLLPLNAIQR